MKSKKAEEFIQSLGGDEYYLCKYDYQVLNQAVELAEKEMREKAIEEFRHFLEDYCHEAGIKIGDIEHYIKVFANQLNK